MSSDRSSTYSSLDNDTLTSTRSGIGRWTGLVETALDVEKRCADRDGDRNEWFERVERQLGRYCWFCSRIESPRSVAACKRALHAEELDGPGARERTLAELSLRGTTEAQLALEAWSPPDQPALEVFYHICLVECARYGSAGR